MKAIRPNNEKQRIEALLKYQVLDTAAEEAFDEITLLTAQICETPVALVSLVDSERQWFKSKVGLSATETCRDVAFCAHALLQTKVFIVEDALKDERFADNPLVTSEPYIRFYAGAPLITPDGLTLGTLCIIDFVPRQLSLAQEQALKILAHQVMTQLELRRNVKALAEAVRQRDEVEVELRKALEKEKELNELKSRFVSMTSHEFRTPLCTILSSSELLERFSDNWSVEKKNRHLERIKSAVQQMNHLLNDILTMGQAEAGKIELNLAPTNLEKFCQDLVEEMQFSIDNQHIINFVSHLTENECDVDDQVLRQILSNLLLNSIKYSPPGAHINFHVSQENGQAIFWIKDNGIGIPPEEQIHLFESFYRAKNVGNIKGTGLGLAIVKKCVDLHGGKIMVSSDLESGTIFRVELPWKKVKVVQTME